MTGLMRSGALVGASAWILAACAAAPASTPKVTNGAPTDAFPFVVRIDMEGGGSCSASFLSDSLLLTAAHCVDTAAAVSYGETKVGREAIAIHPGWPMGGTACAARRPETDVALVRFPPGTYQGEEVGRLLARAPVVGEPLTIVGYGNSEIKPFESFCRMPKRRGEDGLCKVELGQRTGTAQHAFSTVFTFSPAATSEGPGCQTECTTGELRDALALDGRTYETLLAETCGGNFRDRGYRETGFGTKRLGHNVIEAVEGGVIRFQGGLGGPSHGQDAASGAGDSGGPLFVQEDGALLIAGVTHGGSLGEREGDAVKKSTYVDLNAPETNAWLAAEGVL